MPSDHTPPADDPLPLPDWLSGADVPSVPDLPALGALAGDLPAPNWSDEWDTLPAPVPAVVERPPDPMPAVTPPPKPRAERPVTPPPQQGGTDALQLSAEAVVEPGGTVCFRTLVVPPDGCDWGDVRVTFRTPAGVRQARVNRKPKIADGLVTWSLGDLDAGGRVPLLVRVDGGPHLAAALQNPPPFDVTFTPRSWPELDVRFTAPTAVRAGETAGVVATIHNLGGMAEGVSLAITRGDTPAEQTIQPVGRLNSGDSADVPLNWTAPTRNGPATWHVRVTAGHQFAATHTVTVEVYTPAEVTVTAPARVALDAAEPFHVTVVNPADSPCPELVVGLTLPLSLEHQSSDGVCRSDGRRVEWVVDGLEANGRQTFTAWLRGYLPGVATVVAEATAAHWSAAASAECECDIARNAVPTGFALALAEMDRPADDLAADAPPPVQGERHILFRMGDTSYAAPITQLNEVIQPPAITPVPNAPDWLLGLANVRGDVLSVVDFPATLGLSSADGGKKSVLVAKADDATTVVGLLVDEVIGIRRLRPNPWDANSRLDEQSRVGEFLSGLSEHQDRLVPVLDLNRVLGSTLLDAFDAA